MGGEYSEVAETSCGASVFAAGNTIYELSGYDLESRTLEVWDLSPDDCGIEGVPSTADCYRYALTDCRCSPNPPKCKQACLVLTYEITFVTAVLVLLIAHRLLYAHECGAHVLWSWLG